MLHWDSEQVPSVWQSWEHKCKGEVGPVLEVSVHTFLTSKPGGGEWVASRHGRFTPSIHFIEGWMDPRASTGLKKEKN